MTFERKIIVGLEDVKAIVLECNEQQCKARVLLSPEKLKFFPKQCPNGHHWDWNLNLDFASSPQGLFVQALQKLRDAQYDKASGFKIFLELEEPKP